MRQSHGQTPKKPVGRCALWIGATVRVVLDDYAKSNWAVAGELVSDREARLT